MATLTNISFVGLSEELFIILQNNIMKLGTSQLYSYYQLNCVIHNILGREFDITDTQTFGALHCYPAHLQSAGGTGQASCGLGHTALFHPADPWLQQYGCLHTAEPADK